jgi:hypothetical protein
MGELMECFFGGTGLLLLIDRVSGATFRHAESNRHKIEDSKQQTAEGRDLIWYEAI